MKAGKNTSNCPLAYVRRFIRRFIKIATSLIPIRSWRGAVKNSITWQLDMWIEGNQWDKLKQNLFADKGGNLSVLLVGNDLTVTGSPITILAEAKALLANGAKVMVVTAGEGSLADALKKEGIPFLVSAAFKNHAPSIKRLAEGFDLVLINSMPSGEWVLSLPDGIKLMWYVHEGVHIKRYIADNPKLGQALLQCKHLYMVSEHAAFFLPDGIQAKVLHLGVPDVAVTPPNKTPDSRLRFAVVGTFTENKGQHLMLEALGLLDVKRLNELELFFIGGRPQTTYFQNLLHQCPPSWPIIFADEIDDQASKWEIFNNFDILCVPSLNESCSLALLEACMLGKPFIISDQVGGKYMLEEGINGLCFAAGDSGDLCRCIQWCLDNRSKLNLMGHHARRAYKEKGTQEQFEENLMKAIVSIAN